MATDLKKVAEAAARLMSSLDSFELTQIPTALIQDRLLEVWNEGWKGQGRAELNEAWRKHMFTAVRRAGVDDHVADLPVDDHAELVVRSFFVFHLCRFMAQRGLIRADDEERARLQTNLLVRVKEPGLTQGENSRF